VEISTTQRCVAFETFFLTKRWESEADGMEGKIHGVLELSVVGDRDVGVDGVWDV
jgi:hypothetical protein